MFLAEAGKRCVRGFYAFFMRLLCLFHVDRTTVWMEAGREARGFGLVEKHEKSKQRCTPRYGGCGITCAFVQSGNGRGQRPNAQQERTEDTARDSSNAR